MEESTHHLAADVMFGGVVLLGASPELLVDRAGDQVTEARLLDAVDSFQTHVVPIIADIDAGFGNEEATYLLAKMMIEAGACAIQIENQVSDEKQCGHQVVARCEEPQFVGQLLVCGAG